MPTIWWGRWRRAEPRRPSRASRTASAPRADAMLELSRITRAYELGGEKAGVFDVSLAVASGTLAVLAGPSGSGKTTLLQVAGLLDTADGGDVMLEGRNVSRLPERQRCEVRLRRLGFVFQTFNLV